MKDGERLSLEQIQAFLAGSEEIWFAAGNPGEIYAWTERTLREQRYSGPGKRGKGLVRRYIAKVTGHSRAQIARLIAQFADSGVVKVRHGKGRRFASRYAAPTSGYWRWWMKRTKH